MSSLEPDPELELGDGPVAPDGFDGLAELWESDVNIRHRARQSGVLLNWGGPTKVGIVSMTLDLGRLVHAVSSYFGMSHCKFGTLKIFGNCIRYPLEVGRAITSIRV